MMLRQLIADRRQKAVLLLWIGLVTRTTSFSSSSQVKVVASRQASGTCFLPQQTQHAFQSRHSRLVRQVSLQGSADEDSDNNNRITASTTKTTSSLNATVASLSPSSPLLTNDDNSVAASWNAAAADTLTTTTALSPDNIDTTTTDDTTYNAAIRQTLAWVSAAIMFGTGLFFVSGPQTSEEFFAGYLVEQSLSVDNLFVFVMLFEYFRVPLPFQNRVLNWGIYGAIVMRAIMIGIGAAAIQQFHAILLVFAAILVYSSGNVLLGMMADDDDGEEDVSQNAVVKFASNLMSSTDEFDGDRFFTFVDGVKKATPLFICMIAVEISDIVFAVDSIPAVFGVTEDPLVVFSSNIFAIMGLRSLYTILSKAATDLKYLEPAVAVVLAFIGFKMIGEYFGHHISTEVALAVVVSLLGTGVGASLYLDDGEKEVTTAQE